MFFQLFVQDLQTGDLGWILGKNPKNKFAKDVRTGCNVTGSFLEGEKQLGSYTSGYFGKVYNDPIIFLETMKKQNLANYVDILLSSVCPTQLKSLAVLFSSLLKSNYPAEAVHATNPFPVKINIGPFPGEQSKLVTKFSTFGGKLGFNVTLLGKRSFCFETVAPMRVDEAVQKVYIISYLLTRRYEKVKGDNPDFTRMAQNWIATAPDNLQNIITGLREKGKSRRVNSGVEKLAAESEEKKDEDTKTASTTNSNNKSKKTGGNNGGGNRKKNQQQSQALEDAGVLVEGENAAEIDEADDESSVSLEETESTSAASSTGQATILSPLKIELDEEVSMHQHRHNLVVSWIIANNDVDQPLTITDLGCAEGQLSALVAERIPKSKITCVDGDPYILKSRCVRLHRNVHAVWSNLLIPESPETWKADVVLLSEIIEHFDKAGRKRLLKFVLDYLQPNQIALTTPNIEYNVNFPQLFPSGFRHKDHLIEYTPAQFQEEVTDVVKNAGYNVETVNLFDSEKYPIQPSFILFAKRDAARAKPNQQFIDEINNIRNTLFTNLFLNRNQVKVDKKKMRAGYKSYHFLKITHEIPYLAPTIAPVEYDAKQGLCLEHPVSAFNFFRDKGFDKVTCERKYMGSRAIVFAYREESKFGPRFRCYTRNGSDFFNGSQKMLMQQLELELSESLLRTGNDFCVLDGEMLPWNLKAENLIQDSFLSPGECAFELRQNLFGENAPETVNAQLFLDSLSNHSSATPLEYRVFNVLALGKVGREGKLDTKVMGSYLNAEKRYALIKSLESERIKCCDYQIVNLSSADDIALATEKWFDYCKSGGEGWVVKNYSSLMCEDESGKFLLPMLKVRGQDYLRIVYGIDYLEPKYFDRIKNRQIGSKRALSRQQHEVADNILKCFLNGQYHHCTIFRAAFFGLDHQLLINATL